MSNQKISGELTVEIPMESSCLFGSCRGDTPKSGDLPRQILESHQVVVVSQLGIELFYSKSQRYFLNSPDQLIGKSFSDHQIFHSKTQAQPGRPPPVDFPLKSRRAARSHLNLCARRVW
jgi:hypothetical protein